MLSMEKTSRIRYNEFHLNVEKTGYLRKLDMTNWLIGMC